MIEKGSLKDINKYNLIEFFGGECPDCHIMAPLVDRLEKEMNVKVLKLEVWHNKENKKYFEGAYGDEIRKRTGGNLPVPTFLNTKTKGMIIEYASYEDLKKWAQGE